MERTYTATVTSHGRERKIQRLVMEELERKHKKLYAKLLAAAEEICDEDDEDPFSRIHAPASDIVVHHVNPAVRAAQRRRQVLANELNSVYE